MIGCRSFLAVALAALLAVARPVAAGDPRDIVFECPCSAVWVPVGGDGASGRLTLTFRLRSHRPTDSGEVWLRAVRQTRQSSIFSEGADVSVGPVRARTVSAARNRTITAERLSTDQMWGVQLLEQLADGPSGPQLALRETLTLWPVSGDGGAGRLEYVDILTDADGDGVGDVNERIAGTDPFDPASMPGISTVDVLALYNDGFRDQERGYPWTHIHHVTAVAGALFADSGTKLRLRTVGMSEVELDDSGWVAEGEYQALSERHGADVTLLFHRGPNFGCGRNFGCATLVGGTRRGHWDGSGGAAMLGGEGALLAAHELGHVFGLAHSARAGEAHGAFRWSRGHFMENSPQGTIMSYGRKDFVTRFSDPDADCVVGPCGVPSDAPGGADAVESLDLLRFQIAAHRTAKLDSDGDGIVDPADALPTDVGEWLDSDGDGVGDNADLDDDNDGVADAEDAFPLDSAEWADTDGDGIGDNHDTDIDNLGPFRDPALRDAVAEALGYSDELPASEYDLGALTSLQAEDRGIRDLTGLELATSLEALDLSSFCCWKRSYFEQEVTPNRVTDLSPLAELARLRHLELNGNEIVDISPLAGLTGMTYLSLTRNQISDLSPLAELTELEHLNLLSNRISDLLPLTRLTTLFRLNLGENDIVDIAPLADLIKLRDLYLYSNRISDLRPLTALARLTWLTSHENEIVDVGPLAALTELEDLFLGENSISDLSPLVEMTGLKRLGLGDNAIVDFAPLAELTGLTSLSLYSSQLSDLSPLSELVNLRRLQLNDNRISDLSPLAELTGLTTLYLHRNRLSDLSPLAQLAELTYVSLHDNEIVDIAPLDGLVGISGELNLSGNEIVDLSPLTRMNGLTGLDVGYNRVSDIGPLVNRKIWGDERSAGSYVQLISNPLDHPSVESDIATLKSWGIGVYPDVVTFPDPVLRDLVAQQGADFVDIPTEWGVTWLYELEAFGAGISDLAGLDAATNLRFLYAGSNVISDLTALLDLPNLEGIDLSDNLIFDLAPLAANAGIGSGDWVTLTGNPLTEESLNTDVAALRKAGARVRVDSVGWVVPLDGGTWAFDTRGYFESLLGTGVRLRAHTPDSGLATVTTSGGALEVTPGTREGALDITLTATNHAGESASLVFNVSITRPALVPLFPSADDAVRQGFLRVVNRSDDSRAVRIEATDTSGVRADPVRLALLAGTAIHVNSDDVENGNAAKRLDGATGLGRGDWRLSVASGLGVEVLSFIRTTDGFLTAMHDVAPERVGVHRVAIFNPASNSRQVSRLRLINLGDGVATVTIRGIDDAGVSPGGPVELSVRARGTLTVSAADIEAGAAGRGALGDGFGKWELRVEADRPIRVMSLLETPQGHLTNLSTVPVAEGGTHLVPLFPSASDPHEREGFVRVINRGEHDARVSIAAFDDTDRRYDPLTLDVKAGKVVHFNSDDLELGNAGKGLTGSTGSGEGDWRLELSSAADIDVLAYVRTKRDGFLTSMHDVVAEKTGRYEVSVFNPGSNLRQVSMLRLINGGSRDAAVTIQGWDDDGERGGDVRLTVPAGRSRNVSAQELEIGGDGLAGKLGDGKGKWRLTVRSGRPIKVMNLLSSPTGHLTNLSTSPSP